MFVISSYNWVDDNGDVGRKLFYTGHNNNRLSEKYPTTDMCFIPLNFWHGWSRSRGVPHWVMTFRDL